MEYTEEFLSKITTLGTLGFNIQKIISVLEIKIAEQDVFISEFNNPNSELRISYEKGVDKSDLVIDQKLFELAKEGDLKAIELYNEHKKTNKTSLDAQEFELKRIQVENEKMKLTNEKEVEQMINDFLGYGNN